MHHVLCSVHMTTHMRPLSSLPHRVKNAGTHPPPAHLLSPGQCQQPHPPAPSEGTLPPCPRPPAAEADWAPLPRRVQGRHAGLSAAAAAVRGGRAGESSCPIHRIGRCACGTQGSQASSPAATIYQTQNGLQQLQMMVYSSYIATVTE